MCEQCRGLSATRRRRRRLSAIANGWRNASRSSDAILMVLHAINMPRAAANTELATTKTGAPPQTAKAGLIEAINQTCGIRSTRWCDTSLRAKRSNPVSRHGNWIASSRSLSSAGHFGPDPLAPRNDEGAIKVIASRTSLPTAQWSACAATPTWRRRRLVLEFAFGLVLGFVLAPALAPGSADISRSRCDRDV
jgi:hypothetical protein